MGGARKTRDQCNVYRRARLGIDLDIDMQYVWHIIIGTILEERRD